MSEEDFTVFGAHLEHCQQCQAAMKKDSLLTMILAVCHAGNLILFYFHDGPRHLSVLRQGHDDDARHHESD